MLGCKPILHYPNFSKKFIVSIQVSRSALVGALEQEGIGGRIPIDYYSKKLSKSQQNYPILEKSALAVISVLDHFRHLILGYEVEVCTSRKAVEYLRGLKDGNTRVSDWVTKIAAYAPLFTFNRDSTAITHILEISEEDNPDVIDSPEDLAPIAYTDGSCADNGKVSASAGIGVHWEHSVLPDYSGYAPSCYTNNTAELAAIIMAMKQAINEHIPRITIVSDSNYAIENIALNMPEWKGRGWKSIRGKQIDNSSEFESIDHLLGFIEVQWQHTPGHVGVPGNEIAHELALKGRLSGVKPGRSVETEQTGRIVPPEILSIRTQGVPVQNIITLEEILLEQSKEEDIQRMLLQCDALAEVSSGKGIRLYQGVNLGLYAKGVIKITAGKEKRVDAIYVPRVLRLKVLKGMHTSKWVSHSGFMTSCDLLLERCFWDSFRRDMLAFIKTCPECQRSNPPRKRPIVEDFVKPTKPGVKVAVDFIGPIVSGNSGHKYIMSVIDMFSHHTMLCPLITLRTEEVLLTFEKYYVAIYGVPEELLSDRGSNFTSSVFSQACSVLQIKHFVTSPYHPATNGMVERLNREIKKRLTSLCNSSGRAWPERLHMVQFAINNSFHSSLGSTPNMLVFGENRRFPKWGGSEANPILLGTPERYIDSLRERLQEIREIAWEHDRAVRSDRNDRLNRNRFVPTFEEGDKVLYRHIKRGKTRPEGFRFAYDGPFVIKRKISLVSYDIGLPGDEALPPMIKRVHVECLRPYFSPMCVPGEDQDIKSQVLPTERTNILPPNTEDPLTSPGSGEETSANMSNPTEQPIATDDVSPVEKESDISFEPRNSTNHKYFTRSKRGVPRRCY